MEDNDNKEASSRENVGAGGGNKSELQAPKKLAPREQRRDKGKEITLLYLSGGDN